jgi:hypothetical protein
MTAVGQWLPQAVQMIALLMSVEKINKWPTHPTLMRIGSPRRSHLLSAQSETRALSRAISTVMIAKRTFFWCQ